MNTKIKSVLAAASLLVLSAAVSQAQILIVNNIYSTFTPVIGGGAVSGNNGTANATTSITFPAFTVTAFPYANNGTIPPTAGSPPLNYFDGVATRTDAWFLDRSAGFTTATFDFALGLDFAGSATTAADFTLNFRTTLNPAGSAEQYTITAQQPLSGIFAFNGNQYTYDVFPSGLGGFLSSNSNITSNIDIAFSRVVVPEPSTYALFGVVGLMGLVAVRRFRTSKKVA